MLGEAEGKKNLKNLKLGAGQLNRCKKIDLKRVHFIRFPLQRPAIALWTPKNAEIHKWLLVLPFSVSEINF